MGTREMRTYPKYQTSHGVTWRMDGPGEYTAEHDHQDEVVISIEKEWIWSGPMRWNGSIVGPGHVDRRGLTPECLHWNQYASLREAKKDIAELIATEWYKGAVAGPRIRKEVMND